jgi:ribosomal protein L40E
MNEKDDQNGYEDDLYCIECGAMLDRRDERCYRCGEYQN